MTADTDKLSPEELASKLEKCRRTATSDRDEVFELLKFYDVLSDEAAPMLRSQEARIKELEAALSSMIADRNSWERQASDRVGDALAAYKRAEDAEADRKALMHVVRVVHAWRLAGKDDALIAMTEICRSYEALPAHLKEEASK